MRTLIALTLLWSFVAFFVGTIRPSTFGRKGKPAPSRAKIGFTCVVVFLVCAFALDTAVPSKSGAAAASTAASSATTQSSASVSASEAPPATAPPQRSDWTYADQVDQITSKQIHVASVQASEKLEFKFPYNGGSTANLQLRKHPRFGTDVILSIDKGQFVCGVEACTVMVRFDDGRAARYTAREPADYSSTALFIQPAGKFIAAAEKAKSVVIEASFYQDGNCGITFPINHLTW